MFPTLKDWKNLNWTNVQKCDEEVLGALIVFTMLYFAFLPVACGMDPFFPSAKEQFPSHICDLKFDPNLAFSVANICRLCWCVRRRNRHFKRNYIHEVDESFAMMELGSVVVSFDDLLDIAKTPGLHGRKFRMRNRNVQNIRAWVHWFNNLCTARFFCYYCNNRRHSLMAIATELGQGEYEGLMSCTFEVA